MVNKKTTKLKFENLGRLVDAMRTSPSDIFQVLSSGSNFDFETVTDGDDVIDFELDLSGIDIKKNTWTVDDEVELAIAIYESLDTAKRVSLQYLIDPGIWSWIALSQIRDYVINRWCDGYATNGSPSKPEACSYFLSGHSSQKQTRCAPRRLYIAADSSIKAEGDYSHVKALLQNTDLYSAIFERQLGSDAELAVEIATVFKDSKREVYRPGIKLVGILLSTVALEVLDRKAKHQLVVDAFNEVSEKLVL